MTKVHKKCRYTKFMTIFRIRKKYCLAGFCHYVIIIKLSSGYRSPGRALLSFTIELPYLQPQPQVSEQPSPHEPLESPQPPEQPQPPPHGPPLAR